MLLSVAECQGLERTPSQEEDVAEVGAGVLAEKRGEKSAGKGDPNQLPPRVLSLLPRYTPLHSATPRYPHTTTTPKSPRPPNSPTHTLVHPRVFLLFVCFTPMNSARHFFFDQ